MLGAIYILLVEQRARGSSRVSPKRFQRLRYYGRDRKRSDSVFKKKPLYQQKIKKPRENTKTPLERRLHNDCGPT